MAQAAPAQDDIQERKGALLRLFDRLLPIVDAIADSVRLAALVGIAMVIWIFLWMTRLSRLSLTTGLLVTAVASLPVLLILSLLSLVPLGLISLVLLAQAMLF